MNSSKVTFLHCLESIELNFCINRHSTPVQIIKGFVHVTISLMTAFGF